MYFLSGLDMLKKFFVCSIQVSVSTRRFVDCSVWTLFGASALVVCTVLLFGEGELCIA